MTPIPRMSKYPTTSIGALVLGGDWACANGDFGGLRYVAQQLADCMPEPTHCELTELAGACNADPDRAAAMWAALKTKNVLHRAIA